MEVKKIENQPVQSDQYVFTLYKIVKDKSGNDVEIVDREEVTSLASLIKQKDSLTASLETVQTKLDAIAELTR